MAVLMNCPMTISIHGIYDLIAVLTADTFFF